MLLYFILYYNSSIFLFSPLDVQALLLADVLVFLQEKDQKYVFASLVGTVYYTR